MTDTENSLHKAKYYLWIGLLMWALIGILAGTILGVVMGFGSRQTVLFAALGLGIGWFGATGLLARSRRPLVPPPPAQLPAQILDTTPAEPVIIGPTTDMAKPVEPQRNDEMLSKEEAREWLDDFLVRQQEEEPGTRNE